MAGNTGLWICAAWALFVLSAYALKIPQPFSLVLSAFKPATSGPWDPSTAVSVWSQSLVFLFASLLIVVSFWRLGKALGGWAGLNPGNALLRMPMEFGLGALGVVQAWLALGFLNLWYRPLLCGWLGGLVLWALWDLGRDWKSLAPKLQADIPTPQGFSLRLLAALGAVQLLGAFGHGLAPETWTDSLVYHLGFLSNWLHRHGMADMPTHSLITFPFAGELYFLNGVLLQSSEVCKLLHAWVFLFTVLFCGGWALEIGGLQAAWLAMGLVSTFPLLVINAWTTQVEGILCFYTVLFLYAFLRLWNGGKGGSALPWAFLGGVFGGMVLSIKYTGLIVFGACLGTWLWEGLASRGWKFPGYRQGLVLGLGSLLCVSGPWFLRNFCWTGDPVYPYLGQAWGGRLLPPFHTAQMIWFSRSFPYDLGPWWKVPWNLTMPPASIFNFLGPLFLCAVPFCLFGWARSASFFRGRFWKSLALYLLGAFFVSQNPRFHIPLFTLFCLALASAAASLRREGAMKGLAGLGAVSALLCFPLLCGISSHYFSCGGIWAGQETRAQYLNRRLSDGRWKMDSWVQGNTDPDSRFLLTSDSRAYDLDRAFDSCMVFDPYPFHQWVRRWEDPAALARKLQEMGTDYVVAAASGPLEGETWLPAEEKLTPREWGILAQFQQMDLEPVFTAGGDVVYKVRHSSR